MDLNFDTGLVTWSLNGKCEVSFNPTDSAFVERVFDTFDKLDTRQEQFKADSAGVTGKAVFELARAMDAQMREDIDSIFEQPVCDALFGSMNVYAMANGLPVWCNLLMTLIDVTDSSFAEEKKKTDPRIAKYVSKYKK